MFGRMGLPVPPEYRREGSRLAARRPCTCWPWSPCAGAFLRGCAERGMPAARLCGRLGRHQAWPGEGGSPNRDLVGDPAFRRLARAAHLGREVRPLCDGAARPGRDAGPAVPAGRRGLPRRRVRPYNRWGGAGREPSRPPSRPGARNVSGGARRSRSVTRRASHWAGYPAALSGKAKGARPGTAVARARKECVVGCDARSPFRIAPGA